MGLIREGGRMSDAGPASRLVLRPVNEPDWGRPQAHQRTGSDRTAKPAGTAAPLSPDDPRWVLAVRARELMQGAMLGPDDRQNLLRTGRVMGLTDFESNLVLAIMQDQARRGQSLASAIDNLAMVPRYHQAQGKATWAAALGWGVAILAAEIGLLAALLA